MKISAVIAICELFCCAEKQFILVAKPCFIQLYKLLSKREITSNSDVATFYALFRMYPELLRHPTTCNRDRLIFKNKL